MASQKPLGTCSLVKGAEGCEAPTVFQGMIEILWGWERSKGRKDVVVATRRDHLPDFLSDNLPPWSVYKKEGKTITKKSSQKEQSVWVPAALSTQPFICCGNSWFLQNFHLNLVEFSSYQPFCIDLFHLAGSLSPQCFLCYYGASSSSSEGFPCWWWVAVVFSSLPPPLYTWYILAQFRYCITVIETRVCGEFCFLKLLKTQRLQDRLVLSAFCWFGFRW